MSGSTRGGSGGSPVRALGPSSSTGSAPAMSALLADMIGSYIDPQSPLGRAISETERGGRRPRSVPDAGGLGGRGLPLPRMPTPGGLLGQALLSAGREALFNELVQGWRDQGSPQWWPGGAFQGGAGWTDITGGCEATFPEGLYQAGPGLWYKNAVCNPSLLSGLTPFDPQSEAVIDSFFGMRTYSSILAPGGANYVSETWTWQASLSGADPNAYPQRAPLLEGIRHPRSLSAPGWHAASQKRSTSFSQGYHAANHVPLVETAPIGAGDTLRDQHVVQLDLVRSGAAVRTQSKPIRWRDVPNVRPDAVPAVRTIPATQVQPLPLEPKNVVVRVLGRGERKLRMPAYRRILVVRVMEETLEICDDVKALFNALPKPIKKALRQRWIEKEFEKGVERPRKSMPCDVMAKAVFDYRQYLEGEAVMRELLWVRMEDWAYGIVGKYAAEAVSRVQSRSGGTISPGYEHSLAPALPLDRVQEAVTGRAAREAAPQAALVKKFAIDERRRRVRNRSAERRRRVAYRSTYGWR